MMRGVSNEKSLIDAIKLHMILMYEVVGHLRSFNMKYIKKYI